MGDLPADVVEDDRPLVEEGAEHPVGAGQLADPCRPRLGDPPGAEAGEAATSVGDAEARVASSHRPPGGAQHPIEDPVELRRRVEREEVEDLRRQPRLPSLHGAQS